jgi:membrane fusion protein, hemolysin D
MTHLPSSVPPKGEAATLVPVSSALTRRRRDSIGTLVTAFESETFAVFEHTKPAREHIVIYVLAAMFALAIGSMSVVKLDRVVTAQGRMVPINGSIYVSPMDKSIVRAIRVKVGDIVKKGQVLATLDPTFARADLTQLQQRLTSDQAIIDRDQAERLNVPFVAGGDNPSQRIQMAIWQQRQAEYSSTLKSYDAQIASNAANLAQYLHDVAQYAKHLKVASTLENMYMTLEKKGWGSKLNALTASASRIEEARLLTDSQNQVKATEQTIQSLRAQRSAYIHKWHSDVETNQVAAENDLAQTQRDLTKAERVNSLTRLVAPENAVVVRIGRASPGSIAGSGDIQSAGQEPLFTLQPMSAPLEADVQIASDDIGFIQRGDRVRLKFDAYDYIRHGTGAGVIETISDDSFRTDPITNQPTSPYYVARVAVTKFHLHDVPRNTHLTPGMTLTAGVMVGKRTILSYLIDGALRIGSNAMREP